jgi:hypothetical protein
MNSRRLRAATAGGLPRSPPDPEHACCIAGIARGLLLCSQGCFAFGGLGLCKRLCLLHLPLRPRGEVGG